MLLFLFLWQPIFHMWQPFINFKWLKRDFEKGWAWSTVIHHHISNTCLTIVATNGNIASLKSQENLQYFTILWKTKKNDNKTFREQKENQSF